MSKKELINACIDLSYNVSRKEMQDAIKEVSGKRYMKADFSVSVWSALYNKLDKIVNGENGTTVLFFGSNVESYRQK